MNAVAVREPIDILLKQIQRYPVLDKKEEYSLAVRYYEDKDLKAANKLVVSNLRFVVKIASEYISYGFSISDLVQEGTIGLMKAVQKFNPYKGYRLISYAVWWIRAKIQNHIMKFWSHVKIGTTQAQRKLFHKIGRAKNDLNIDNERMNDAEVTQVAKYFGVKAEDIVDMEVRTAARDFSLDAASSDESNITHLEALHEPGRNQEEILEFVETTELTHRGLERGMTELSDREQRIIESRYLSDPPTTLRELSDEFKISKERVRQIEVQALKKLRGTVETVMTDKGTADTDKQY